MQRSDIQEALEAARAISKHHEFVIVGSLSVLGLMETPPEAMSYSIDIDFYPLRDPGRASEIAGELGENSLFHEQNGYFLDAVSPDLPVLPDGWRDRMVKVELGQATAFFLDVHDIAVSKYARGAENDYRWIEAGYTSKILDIDTIATRVRFGTTFYDDEDQRKTANGLLMHRIAIRSDGSLASGVLDYLQANPPAQKIKEVDEDEGHYHGPILWTDGEYAVQSLGRGNIAIHASSAWSVTPEVDEMVEVRYHGGDVSVDSQARESGTSLDL